MKKKSTLLKFRKCRSVKAEIYCLQDGPQEYEACHDDEPGGQYLVELILCPFLLIADKKTRQRPATIPPPWAQLLIPGTRSPNRTNPMTHPRACL